MIQKQLQQLQQLKSATLLPGGCNYFSMLFLTSNPQVGGVQPVQEGAGEAEHPHRPSPVGGVSALDGSMRLCSLAFKKP